MEHRATTTFRAPMRRVLYVTAAGFGVLLPVATALAWVVAGSEAGIGILLGLAIPAAFFGLTVLAGVAAAALENGAFVGVVMASWLVKVVALIIFLAAVKDSGFYDKGFFFAGMVVGVAGWLTAEMVIVLRAKVPYVDLDVERDGEVPGGA